MGATAATLDPPQARGSADAQSSQYLADAPLALIFVRMLLVFRYAQKDG